MDIDILFVIGILLIFNIKTCILGFVIISIAYLLKTRNPARKNKKNID
ncbi:MAG: hypothetical protein RSC93_02950 [Erysipelotrichaceae bacterium]